MANIRILSQIGVSQGSGGLTTLPLTATFNSLSAGSLSADKLIVGSITTLTSIVNFTVSSNYTISGNLTALGNIYGSNTGTAFFSNLVATSLTATNLTILGAYNPSSISAQTLSAGNATFAVLSAGSFTPNSISAAGITAYNTLSAGNEFAGSISAGSITSVSISSIGMTGVTLSSNNLFVGVITTNSITAITNISTNTISSNTLSSGFITFSSLSGNSITAKSISSNTITANNFILNSTSALTSVQNGVFEYYGTTNPKLTFTASGFRKQLNKRIAQTISISSVNSWNGSVIHSSSSVPNTWVDVKWSPELSKLVAIPNGQYSATSYNGIIWGMNSLPVN